MQRIVTELYRVPPHDPCHSAPRSHFAVLVWALGPTDCTNTFFCDCSSSIRHQRWA